MLSGSQIVIVDAATQNEGPDYSVNYGTGVITFTTAPASGSNNIDVDYTYYVIDSIKINVANAAGGTQVDLTGAETILNYQDANTLSTDITNYTLTRLGNADADNLLEEGEVFEISVATSSFGLTAGDLFTIQVKPPVGAIIDISRRVPAIINAQMDMG